MVWWMTLGLVLSISSLLMYGLNLIGPSSSGVYFGLVIPTQWIAVALGLLWISIAYGFYRKTPWLNSIFSITLGLELVLLFGTIFSHAENVQLLTRFFRDNPEMAGGLPSQTFVESSLFVANLISFVMLAVGLTVLYFVLKNKESVKP